MTSVVAKVKWSACTQVEHSYPLNPGTLQESAFRILPFKLGWFIPSLVATTVGEEYHEYCENMAPH